MKGVQTRVGYLVILACLACSSGCQSPAGSSKFWFPWSEQASRTSAQSAFPAEVPLQLGREQKADIEFALGVSAERQGRVEEAKAIYHEVVKAAPKRADVHHRLALLYSRQGECEAAEEYYLKAVQLEPGNALLHGDLGYNYYLQEKWPEAEARLRRAIELDGRLARARNNLGMLLARTGREAEAMHQFAKAGCDRAQASANLALAMALEGRIESAQEEYQRALRQNPNLKGARDMLARLESLSTERPANYETPVSPGSTNAVVPAFHHQHVGNTPN